MSEQKSSLEDAASETEKSAPEKQPSKALKEIGGPKGLELNRYGDWEKGGRAINF